MGEEVELLKDYAHLTAYGDNIFGLFAQVNAVNPNVALSGDLKIVNAAQQSGFTRPTGANNYNDFAGLNGKGNVINGFHVAKMFVQLLNYNHAFIGGS